MARKVLQLDEAPLDVVSAIKRAFLQRGLVRNIIRKEAKPEPASSPEKLADLTIKAHDILYKCNTLFPFTLFPDTVTLDREKLTVAERFFFRMAKILSVPIADILSVEAHVGPLFGSVSITSRYFSSNPLSVKYLARSDAVRIQHLVQGYIIAHERKVDCANIEKEELVVLLKDLGQGATD